MVASIAIGWTLIMVLILFTVLLFCGCFPFITGSHFLSNTNCYDKNKLAMVAMIGYSSITVISFITFILKIYASGSFIASLNILFPTCLMTIFLLMTLASHTWCKHH